MSNKYILFIAVIFLALVGVVFGAYRMGANKGAEKKQNDSVASDLPLNNFESDERLPGENMIDPVGESKTIPSTGSLVKSGSETKNSGTVNKSEISKINSTVDKKTSGVFVNGLELSDARISEFVKTYGQAPAPGKYWYDSKSGWYGYVGGPIAGVMYPGHDYGKLSATASNGTSGSFINGRELQNQEAIAVASLFNSPPVQGNFTLDSTGNLSMDGLGFIGNVYVLLSQATQKGGGGSGGDNFWSSRMGAGNFYTDSSGNPSQGYVSVPGYGPVSYGF